MTYAHGSVAQTTDYNTLAGSTSAAAASSAAATKVAGYLWGIGYGDRGYGQTSPSLGPTGQVEQAITSLQSVLSSMCTWQNTAATLLPSVASVSAGAVATAYPTGGTPSIVDLLTALDTNRLNNVVGNMTLVSSAATNTRSTVWGQSGAGITGTITVTFASADAARYFFNSGGQLRLVLAHPNTSTVRDTDWHNALAAVGTINFSANGTALTGSTDGTAGNFGYYQCGSVQTILSAVVFPSPYNTNTVTVTAAVSGTASNGGPGQVVTFTITMNDTYQGLTGAAGCQAGTNAVLSHLRAGAVLAVLPAAPTCAVGTNF